VDAGGGDNTGERLNFLPHMDAAKLVEGYRSVLKQIYSSAAYYERVKLYLSRIQAKSGGSRRVSGSRATVVNAVECAGLRDFDCAPGVFGRAAVELLEVSANRYDTISALALALP